MRANPGVEKVDFELWSSAVSAINGFGMCLDSHEVELKHHAAPAPNIQGVLRIASVVVVTASAVLRPIQ